MYRENTKKVLKYTPGLIGGIIAMALVGFIGWYFMDIDLIVGNLGKNRATIEIVLLVLLMVLFGFFVMMSLYKMHYFSSMGKKETGLGAAGGFLGILVVGCPACSVTIASYIGLASVLSLLPYNGLELKIAGVLLLIYTIRSSLITLETCSLKRKK